MTQPTCQRCKSSMLEVEAFSLFHRVFCPACQVAIEQRVKVQMAEWCAQKRAEWSAGK